MIRQLITGVSFLVLLSASVHASEENNQPDILKAITKDRIVTLSIDKRKNTRGERFYSKSQANDWRNNNCGIGRMKCLSTKKESVKITVGGSTYNGYVYVVPWYKQLFGPIHSSSGARSY